MASLSPEEKVEFLLNVLATMSEFKPDYGALAEKTGINTNTNAQRKLKSIVEAGKRYMLQSDKTGVRVIDTQNVGEGEQQTSLQTPKSRKRSKKADDGANDEGTPSKRGRKAKPKEDEKQDGMEETKDSTDIGEEGEDAI